MSIDVRIDIDRRIVFATPVGTLTHDDLVEQAPRGVAGRCSD